MRILMVGDVVGKAGRQLLVDVLQSLRIAENIDFVIVNGENAAAGVGITPDLADQFLAHGADVVTLGNHAWNRREVYNYLENQTRILRPANYPPGVPGHGFHTFCCLGTPLSVIVLQGRVFMEPIDDPFRKVDELLDTLIQKSPLVFVDFHGEATSEKQAFGYYVDGRVTGVFGTHTHVQTADERVLPGGTAYITDVGMTGPVQSVIGMKYESVIPRFLTGLPSRFDVADGAAQLCAVVVEVRAADGKAITIKRLQISQHAADALLHQEETRQ